MSRTLLLILILLAGCSALPPPTPSPSQPVASAPTVVRPTSGSTATLPRPSPSPPPSPTPTPPPLTLWVAEEGPALDLVGALVAEFSQRSAIAIELRPRPPDGLRLSLATAALQGEGPPDLLWGDQEALAGLLGDGYLQPVPDEALPAETLPALLTAARSAGHYWGVPVSASGALLLLYNRALVTSPPTTSDALIAQARAAESPEVAGMVQAWNEARWLLPWLYAFGGAPTSADGQTITLDTPAMTATLNLMRELYGSTSEGGRSYDRGQRLLTQGYAALAIDGDWALPGYRSFSQTLDLGVAPLPVVPATGRPAAPTLGGSYLMFGQGLSAEERSTALAFAALLNTPATQTRLAVELGRLPATRSALAALPATADPALLAAAALAPDAPGLPPTTAARCALWGIDVWLPNLLKGTLNPAETPATMQREAEQCLQAE